MLVSSKKAFKFLKYHLTSIIIFAILYWFQDWFITNYPELSKKIYFGGNNGPPPNSFLYYLWFSLITQTTVGYGGIIEADGTNTPFVKIQSHLLKALNIIQLLSIFLITAVLI